MSNYNNSKKENELDEKITDIIKLIPKEEKIKILSYLIELYFSS